MSHSHHLFNRWLAAASVLCCLMLASWSNTFAADIGGNTYANSDLGLGANYSFADGGGVGEDVHTWSGVNTWTTGDIQINSVGGDTTVLEIGAGGTTTFNHIATTVEEMNGAGTLRIRGTFNHDTNTIFDINDKSTAVFNVDIGSGGKYVFNTVGSDVGTLRFNRDQNNGDVSMQLKTGGVIEVNDTSGTDHAIIQRSHFGADGIFTLEGGTIDVNSGRLEITQGGTSGAFFRASSGTINVAAGAELDIAQAQFIGTGTIGGQIDGTFTINTTINNGGVFPGNSDVTVDFEGNGLTIAGNRLFPGNNPPGDITLTNKGRINFSPSANVATDNNGDDLFLNINDGGEFIHTNATSISGHFSRGVNYNLGDAAAGGAGGTYEFQDAATLNRAVFTIFDDGVLKKTGAGTAEIAEETGGGNRNYTLFDIKSGGSVEVTGGQLNVTTDSIQLDGVEGLTPAGALGFNLLIDNARFNIDSNKGNGVTDGGDPIPLVSVGAGSTLDLRAAAQFTNDTVDLLDSSITTVDGTLLVSNGFTLTPGGGTLTVGTGGVVGGDGGTIDGTIVVGGGATDAPGLSVGTANAVNETWLPGGTFQLEIDDATGTAGVSPGWDLRALSGDLDISGLAAPGDFTIDLDSLLSGGGTNPGDADSFDPTQSYEWEFITYANLIGAFDPSFFTVDSSGFSNPTDGGDFGVVETGANGLALAFTPSTAAIPEPASILLWTLLGLTAAVVYRRRRASQAG